MNVETVNDWGKRYGDALKFMSGLGAIALTIKSFALPAIEHYFDATGPAAFYKDFRLDPVAPGEEGRLIVTVDKIRDCSIQRFALKIIDDEGLSYPAHNTVSTIVLPIELGQVMVYSYIMPKNIKHGVNATAVGEGIYGHCRDGEDPKEPVVTPVAKIMVLRPTDGTPTQ